ncbi:DUF4064 domain-containing protein [Mammaliicoccus sciuri]|uniref:DUF4064 domain-containing protein n=1 Tax=Mammaliicoccus sciuri TaxID=1296 RepID=UPI001952BBFA|nr:DUF4064 domain-containing protein [Mammaliicoccus sciuri]MCJ1764251.1 DUF4064 domain-containing protein [Mammaliicoccus sciuri]MCJ1773034.1 DUF4064 domain-containing protein [Mammaliicoccus sciuri]
MKRTTEYILLVVGAVFSLIGIVLAFITKSFSNTAEFKMEFERQVQNNPDLQNEISSDQLSTIMSSFTNYALVILIISIVLAIVAFVFVKKQRILSGISAILGGLVSILIFNVISFLVLIIAGIMLLVRKDKNHQFEDVNFQNDHNHLDGNNQQNQFNSEDKKKKDDDPYIY